MKHSILMLSVRAAKTALVLVLFSVFSTTALAEKVNLNLADVEALQYIPGIGLSRAEKIIDVREKVGKFTSMEEIDAVPGIGARTMLDIRKYGSLDSGVTELTEEMKANQPVRSEASVGEKKVGATSS